MAGTSKKMAEKPKASKKKASSTTKAKRKSRKRKTAHVVVARGKRKEAIARAVIKEGKGRFTFNKVAVDAIDNLYIKEMLMEPINVFGGLKDIDVRVEAKGGGIMGQIQAARRAIAVGLVEFTGNEKLWDKFYEVDKYLVVEDPRRVEPKKYKGRKARARFQKSYR